MSGDEILTRVHSALGEIDCAISQSIPSDDRIIAEHIQTASRVLHELADQLNADQRERGRA